MKTVKLLVGSDKRGVPQFIAWDRPESRDMFTRRGFTIYEVEVLTPRYVGAALAGSATSERKRETSKANGSAPPRRGSAPRGRPKKT